MLKRLLQAERNRFEELANAWLSAGASDFRIWHGERVLAAWPAVNGREPLPGLRAPIWFKNREVGILEVSGVAFPGAKERLAADASFIAELLALDKQLDDIAAELIASQDQLLAMYNLSSALSDRLSLDDVTARLVQEVMRLMDITAAFIAVQLPGRAISSYQLPDGIVRAPMLEFYLRMVRERECPLVYDGDQTAASWTEGHAKHGARRLLPDLIPLTVEHAKGMTPNSLLLMPIFVRGAVVATLGLVVGVGESFNAGRLKLARAIAEQAAAQIEKVFLYQEQLTQVQLQTEMKLAQNVQFHLLPRQLPRVEGLGVWAYSRPASQVGGDFYDFFACSNADFTFSVGDVSGKGMPAALLMAMTRSVIRTKANTVPPLSPESLVGLSNEALYDDFNQVSMFATVFMGQYQSRSRELVYANAGHSPVIYCPAGGRASLIEADGMPMGILPTTSSQNQQLHLGPGDTLIIGTDGLSEARNAKDEMFGYDRLLHSVETLGALQADQIAGELYQRVDRFVGAYPQDDDQTLVVLKGEAA